MIDIRDYVQKKKVRLGWNISTGLLLELPSRLAHSAFVSCFPRKYPSLLRTKTSIVVTYFLLVTVCNYIRFCLIVIRCISKKHSQVLAATQLYQQPLIEICKTRHSCGHEPMILLL